MGLNPILVIMKLKPVVMRRMPQTTRTGFPVRSGPKAVALFGIVVLALVVISGWLVVASSDFVILMEAASSAGVTMIMSIASYGLCYNLGEIGLEVICGM